MSAPTTNTAPVAGPRPAGSRSLRWFLVAFVGVVGVMVFVLAPRASSSPDGLEKVAADTGIDASVREHALADAPLADYTTTAVGDEGLATGVAGTLGVAVTLGAGLLLAKGLARRRRPFAGP